MGYNRLCFEGKPEKSLKCILVFATIILNRTINKFSISVLSNTRHLEIIEISILKRDSF